MLRCVGGCTVQSLEECGFSPFVCVHTFLRHLYPWTSVHAGMRCIPLALAQDDTGLGYKGGGGGVVTGIEPFGFTALQDMCWPI